MRSITDGSSTYVPALIQRVGAFPRVGFSTKATTSPSGRVGTTPNDDGSSTWVSEIVASAPRAAWNSTSARRSSVVSTSPLHTTTRSPIPWVAKRIAPAVPSGSSSTANRIPDRRRVLGEVRLERVGEVPEREHDLVDAVGRQPRELTVEERFVGDGEQRFRRAVRERAQACALPAHEDDRLHGLPVAVVVVAAGAVELVED